MKIRTRVKLVDKVGEHPYYAVYLIDLLNEENLIKVCSFKKESEPDDKYWGENVAREEALKLAKDIEKSNIFGQQEKIIYETPVENEE